MNQSKQLNTIERKIFRTYTNDGLADLFIGLWFALAGVLLLTDQAAFIGLSALPVLLYIPAKKQLIVPRMGEVRFSKKRKKQLSGIGISSIIIGIAMLLIIVLILKKGSMRKLTTQYDNIAFGFIIVTLVCLVGILIDNRRFYLYAVIGFIAFTLINNIPIVLLSYGVLILLTGGILLVRFLINNPIDNDEKEITKTEVNNG